jgi:flagellar biosynthesis/type III secretory pathway chaperone
MKNLNIVLDQQLNLLEELKNLLKRETNELSEIHLDAMAEINGQKEDLSSRIAAHAETLRNAIQEVAAREGLSTKASLGELAVRLQQNGNRDIVRLHAELNVAAGQIKELLVLNREVAERFAASVTGSLELVTRIINQTSTYGASGSYQQRPAGSMLINREA